MACPTRLPLPNSLLTTFNSPFSRYRLTRLPFGLIVSQDVFQKELDNALEGLPGVTGIGLTEKEHDENLLRVMERAREKRIKFNADKLQLRCDEASFFGHTWTPEGVNPDKISVSHTCHEAPWQRQGSTELPRFSKLPDEVLKPVGNNHCISS